MERYRVSLATSELNVSSTGKLAINKSYVYKRPFLHYLRLFYTFTIGNNVSNFWKNHLVCFYKRKKGFFFYRLESSHFVSLYLKYVSKHSKKERIEWNKSTINLSINYVRKARIYLLERDYLIFHEEEKRRANKGESCVKSNILSRLIPRTSWQEVAKIHWRIVGIIHR